MVIQKLKLQLSDTFVPSTPSPVLILVYSLPVADKNALG